MAGWASACWGRRRPTRWCAPRWTPASAAGAAATAAHGLGQRKAEGGAFLHLALGPHVAAVAADDALHGGQTDTRAFELAGRVQPLEGAEELVGIGHVEAGAVVAHEEGALACVSGCAAVVRPFAQSVGEAALARRDGSDLDARRVVLAGEPPGVAEEVVQRCWTTSSATPGGSPASTTRRASRSEPSRRASAASPTL